MFQYTKETVLNNPEVLELKKAVNPYTLRECQVIKIKGVGEYYSDCIEGDLYKTVGYEGKPGKLDLSNVTFAAPGEHVLTFRVVTPNQFLAEYASPAFKDFGKPMVIGFNVPAKVVDGAVSADSAAGKKNMLDAIAMAIPADNKFVTLDEAVLTGSSNYMTFDRVKIERYDATMCDSCEGQYIDLGLKEGEDYTIEANVESFATGQWILENLRFPTYPNIRYASASTQMPIVGETYVEYAFTYAVPRVGLGGLSGVGQDMKAVTRHIFFVPVGKVAEFEKIAGENESLLKIKEVNVNTGKDERENLGFKPATESEN